MTPVFLVFFNDPATTEISPLSLHDALPICAEHYDETVVATAAKLAARRRRGIHILALVTVPSALPIDGRMPEEEAAAQDRKSTRLNSSHANISYAVFCLKKKDQNNVYRGPK